VNARLKTGKKIDGNEMKKILEESWIGLKKEERDDNIMKFKILKDIKNYHRNISRDIREVKEIEQSLGANFDTVRVRGRLDLFYQDKNGKNVLMDFKSRKLGQITQTHTDLQLRMYALALENTGQKVDRLVGYPIQEERFEIKEGELPFSDHERKDVKKIVARFARDVKEHNLDGTKTETHFCKKCPYSNICSSCKSK